MFLLTTNLLIISARFLLGIMQPLVCNLLLIRVSREHVIYHLLWLVVHHSLIAGVYLLLGIVLKVFHQLIDVSVSLIYHLPKDIQIVFVFH